MSRVRAVPVGDRTLAGGVVVVDGAIVARLLGVRLLKLDLSLAVAPAQVTTSARPAAAPPPPPPIEVNGSRRRPRGQLAEAVRLIDEGTTSLAALRDESQRQGGG